MNWHIWDQVEQILLRASVRPVLAVIPDNQDLSLRLEPAAAGLFWKRVREWQQRGWSIGLHGYQHLYVSASAGVVGLDRRSEFAGLPEKLQNEKLTSALEIFTQQGVKPDLWVAPGHSFDMTTVRLLRHHGIGVISDGFSWRPYEESGLVWIPQQLWRLRPMPLGVWTVCLHHNRWHERDVAFFERDLGKYCDSLIDVPHVLSQKIPTRSCCDRIFKSAFHATLRMRRKWHRRAVSPNSLAPE